MIYGIGTDLILVERIQAVYAAHPRRWPRKLLHPLELEQFGHAARPANFLAKAWAVKEAFGKALGTGVRGYRNPDVGVLRGALGKPDLVYSAAMRERMTTLGISRGHVSMSDDDGRVIAFVVLESA